MNSKYFEALTDKERRLFRALNTPPKIQDFLNSLPINMEKNGETLMSPRLALKNNKAHCTEGALLAAAILWYHGKDPILLDFQATKNDWNHAVAIFNKGKYYGAISKTNHVVLRYREPIYKSIRELALSYFHEYYLDNGYKTLRTYSKPFHLKNLGSDWITDENDLWYIDEMLDKIKHFPILNKSQIRVLRRVDPIEIEAGKLTEWK